MTVPRAEIFGIAALSLRVAALATLAACAIGVPAGAWLGSTVFRGRRTMLALLNTALAIPIAASLSAAAFQAVDPRVGRTALTLGAGPLRTAWAVAREARLALLATVAVAFGRVMSEVGAALIAGGNVRHETRTLTTAITLATSQGDFSLAIALGLILLALALTVNVCLQLLRGRGDA